MHPLAASALRRAGLMATALAVTLLAHAVAAGHLSMVPVAPAVWVGIVAVVTVLSAMNRPGAFTAWSPARVLAALLAAQAGLHVVLHFAPWVFGLVPHHATPLVGGTAMAVHILAALLLWGPLCWGQRVLARAARLVRALVVGTTRRPLPRPQRVAAGPAWTPHPRDAHPPRSSRGPPGRVRPARAEAAAP